MKSSARLEARPWPHSTPLRKDAWCVGETIGDKFVVRIAGLTRAEAEALAPPARTTRKK